MERKVEYLVVDTSAFIKNAQLQEIGQNMITLQDVVDEVTSNRQLKRLVVLPYDLQIKDSDVEDIKFVTEFSKKTGDYPSLSSTDIKVIALTYKLEREHVGSDHLKSQPTIKAVELVDHSLLSAKDVVGFYLPASKTNPSNDGEEEMFEDALDAPEEVVEVRSVSDGEEDEFEEVPDIGDDIIQNIEGLNVGEESDDDDEGVGLSPSDILGKAEASDEEYSDYDNDDDDDDESGWITPSNVAKAKKVMGGGVLEEKPVKVACLTTDFAMQNVLKQIGLNVVSLDGLLINEVKTFIFRCYACFKTTSIMTKTFCPNCGNKTLKRVAVTVDKDGKQHIHINFRRPLTARGKRFPLPKPQGGKHALNPVTVEDQRFPQQRLSNLARKKNDPLDPDYIAGFSPFVMRDVSSRSVVLGLHRKHEFKYWMKRNPNEGMKKKRKK